VTDSDAAPHPHAHHVRVQRTARYYTLGGSPIAAPRTIWFVLHGHGQLAGDFIRYFADLANSHTLIVAPEAMNRFYTVSVSKTPASERPVGATWMTREDRASEIADYVEYLDTVYAELASEPVAEGAAVNIIGFSQGAATATRWMTHGSARIDRLVLWGGLLPPETNLSRGADSLRRVALTYVLGSRDHYVSDDQLAADVARVEKAGIAADVIRFDGGHAVSRSVFAQLSDPVSGASGR
jgi:predicted esterase